MEVSTVNSRYQIALPETVRSALGVVPGDKVHFVPAWQGYRLVVIKGDITSLCGVLAGRRKKPLSIEEMNATIANMGSMREPQL